MTSSSGAPPSPLDARDCALAAAPESRATVAGCVHLALPAQRPPWQATGLRVL